MLLLPSRASFFRRSNRHLHHRRAATHCCVSALIEVRWGTGDLGVSDSNTGTPFGAPAPWRVACPREAASTVRASQAGFEPASTIERSIRHLHHQRRLSRSARSCASGKPKFFCGARCAAMCELPGVRSVIGVRLIASFPPTGPAHLGTRVVARAPGSGSPVPAFAG